MLANKRGVDDITQFSNKNKRTSGFGESLISGLVLLFFPSFLFLICLSNHICLAFGLFDRLTW
jgi:hypothetical protein